MFEAPTLFFESMRSISGIDLSQVHLFDLTYEVTKPIGYLI